MKIPGFAFAKPELVGLDPEPFADHYRRSREHLNRGNFPGCAECVLVKDKVAYLNVHGYADIEHKVPTTERTRFRGYSLTKPITAIGLLVLVEQGKVRLNDPLSKYIPSFGHCVVVRKGSRHLDKLTRDDVQHIEPLKRPVTVRDAMLHTSGMGYGPARNDLSKSLRCSGKTEKAYRNLVVAADEDELPDLASFCDAVAKIPLRFQPGTQWKYSYGMDVIGRVIEVASGTPLPQFLRKYVLQPLGMQDTTFAVPPKIAERDMSANYILKRPSGAERGVRVLERVDGKKAFESAWVANSPNAPSVTAGGGIFGSCRGGLVFSLRDLCHFCFWLASDGVKINGERFLKPSTARSLRTDWLRKRPLRGWDDNGGDEIGWSPVGHVAADGVMFMAGVGSWWVDAKRHLAAISLCEVVADVGPYAYNEARDDVLAVLLRSLEKYNKQTSRKSQRAKGLRTKTTKSKRVSQKMDGKKRLASATHSQNTTRAKRTRVDSTSSDKNRRARTR